MRYNLNQGADYHKALGSTRVCVALCMTPEALAASAVCILFMLMVEMGGCKILYSIYGLDLPRAIRMKEENLMNLLVCSYADGI